MYRYIDKYRYVDISIYICVYIYIFFFKCISIMVQNIMIKSTIITINLCLPQYPKAGGMCFFIDTPVQQGNQLHTRASPVCCTRGRALDWCAGGEHVILPSQKYIKLN